MRVVVALDRVRRGDRGRERDDALDRDRGLGGLELVRRVVVEVREVHAHDLLRRASATSRGRSRSMR